MGKKIKQANDPILEKLNGVSRSDSSLEEEQFPAGQPEQEEDPILKKLNATSKKKESTVSAQNSGATSNQGGQGVVFEPSEKQSVPSEKSTVKEDQTAAKVEFLQWNNSRMSELQSLYEKQIQKEVSDKRNELDKELKGKFSPGTREWNDAVQQYEKQIRDFSIARGKELANTYNQTYLQDRDRKVSELKDKFVSLQDPEQEKQLLPQSTGTMVPSGPYGMTSSFGRSLVNLFANTAPSTIYRQALESIPSDYNDLLKKTQRGSGPEKMGLLTKDKIMDSSLDELLDEYKDHGGAAAKDTYSILKEAKQKLKTDSPELVWDYYKTKVNQILARGKEKYKEENVDRLKDREASLIGGIPQEFTGIKTPEDFLNWLGGSLGQGVGSSLLFATSPAIVYKMERYDALDEIRAKKAEALSSKFGEPISTEKLTEIQSKDENAQDESLATTIASISTGLEGIGLFASAGTAIKNVFFNKMKKEITEQAIKQVGKGVVKDLAVAGGGEFATEYLQDVDQQIGGLMASGMSLTESLANVDHKRAFNAGMQGLAPGLVLGSVSTGKSQAQPLNKVIEGQQKTVDTSNFQSVEAAAQAIDANIDESTIIQQQNAGSIQENQAGIPGQGGSAQEGQGDSGQNVQQNTEQPPGNGETVQQTGEEVPLGKESIQVGITSATDKIPEIAALMKQGRDFEKSGKFAERDQVFNKVLDLGENTIRQYISSIPGAKIRLDRTVGNFFGYSEPTFKGTMDVPVESRAQAFAAIAKAAREMNQDAVHISSLRQELAQDEVFGQENQDGSVFEPDVDITFDQELTPFEIKKLEKITQKEAGMAGFTINPDKKGINMYNISKFTPYEKFTEQVGTVLKRLHSSGVRFSVSQGVRALWNIGSEESGATRSYEQVESQFSPQEVTTKSDVMPVFQSASDLLTQIQSSESASKRRRLSEQRRSLLQQNPSVKYIDDNIKSIYKQLEQNGIITREGDCP